MQMHMQRQQRLLRTNGMRDDAGDAAAPQQQLGHVTDSLQRFSLGEAALECGRRPAGPPAEAPFGARNPPLPSPGQVCDVLPLSCPLNRPAALNFLK